VTTRTRTGTGLTACLRVAGLLFGCLVANLAWVSVFTSAAQCTLKRTGSADISIRNDHVMVPVTINGHRAAMELNTAAATSVIFGAYMKPFGLKQDHSFEGKVTWPDLISQRASAFCTFPMRTRRSRGSSGEGRRL
jgi:hypothetical protein